ncbi:MAG: MarR family winged helix-turn-helix transcriptional regulator [Peptoniphilaceae bacterium]|uniref:MarR family winged helix-turn-helix transcriptional regulator n=1 Tax=Parvimonas sp. TaxID=1944660 RepID=UPI0025DF3783|nr:MarR family winged helix-turn-helix transcriptional regulator [Parvimonas sp.]MCI5997178.1 MarR family winged helix-turn-helix transcriptional regulator [Parvimonas sp.]MDD7764271.1 MarR family winged helix-turn-helix transcriptional regulator [Peptoniphilaceae bacterium]MDY3051534.1 MarR family winged helix-turn-helix transcriptional regulator [Parvimonas sp.]
MAENKTRQTLNELLVDLFNFILYIQEKHMREKGVTLTMSEVHLLESVIKSKNNTVTNIADAMLITKGTFSVNASRLIKKGYLIKYKDEEDKRIVRVEITDKARKVLKIHDEFHENLIDRALEDLNLSDNETLNKSFESILNYFKTEYKKMSKKEVKKLAKKDN